MKEDDNGLVFRELERDQEMTPKSQYTGIERRSRTNDRRVTVGRRTQQRRDAARADLLEHISHELREPVNAVIALADLAKMGITMDKDDFLRHCDVMNTAAMNVLTVINDILDLAKLEGGMMEVRKAPINIANVINRAILQVAYGASKRNVSINFIAPDFVAVVDADSIKIRQAICNLISNAIKFTDVGTVVDIGVTASSIHVNARPHRAITISVSDQGPGIPEADLDHIFDEFYQASDKNNLGSGLGLTICREIVELHGGIVSAMNNADKGATFYITIPVRTIHASKSGRRALDLSGGD